MPFPNRSIRMHYLFRQGEGMPKGDLWCWLSFASVHAAPQLTHENSGLADPTRDWCEGRTWPTEARWAPTWKFGTPPSGGGCALQLRVAPREGATIFLAVDCSVLNDAPSRA